MARKRRTSAVLETARQRLAGLKKITPEPNLGPNVSVSIFDGKVSSFTNQLDSHNQLLAAADDSSNVTDAAEGDLGEWNRRILSAVEAQFGPDSSEYEMVGGTRKSERKRPTRKTAAAGSTTTTQ